MIHLSLSRFGCVLAAVLACTFILGSALPVAAQRNTSPMDNDADGLTNQEEKFWGTSKQSADTDADGLTDGIEVNQYNTDPTSADSDDDGLTDQDEIAIYGTTPWDGDSDDDGALDGAEIAAGTNPLDPSSFPQES